MRFTFLSSFYTRRVRTMFCTLSGELVLLSTGKRTNNPAQSTCLDKYKHERVTNRKWYFRRPRLNSHLNPHLNLTAMMRHKCD